jgi:hypothetical protein
MKVRWLLLLVLFLSLSALGIFGQSAIVGAWNIQWLESPSSRPGDAKGKAQQAADK